MQKLGAWVLPYALQWACFVGLLFLACASAPPPRLDYTLARAAMEAARKAEAPQKTPGYFQQGLDLFTSAENSYREERYDLARDFFRRARALFEKSENMAKVITEKSESN